MSGIIAQNTLDNSGLIKSPAAGGAWNFIKKLTASTSATLSFVDGTSDVVLDSTYKEYLFTFKDIHPGTDNVDFTFNMSIDSGSNYNVTKTDTYGRAMHNEADDATDLSYDTDGDVIQSTDFAMLAKSVGADADQMVAGYLYLYTPSNTTYAKHWISNMQVSHQGDYSMQVLKGGYGNTTTAVDACQFKMSSGNIDAGDICLYGVTT